MKNAKFWLVQIAMVAIVSLIFGSPVFASPDGDPTNGKRQGAQTENDHNSNGVAHSNGAARGFVPAEPTAAPPVVVESGCAPGQLDLYGDGSECI